MGKREKQLKVIEIKTEVTLRLSKNALSGNDSLFVPNNTVKRLEKSIKDEKGMEVKIKRANIRKQLGGGGPKIGNYEGGGAPRIGAWGHLQLLEIGVINNMVVGKKTCKCH